MYRLKIFFALMMMFSTHSFANQCFQFYSESRTLDKNLPITDRFSNFYKERQGEFFGLLIEDFVAGELHSTRTAYDEAFAILDVKGTDSKLDSEFKTLNVYFERMDRYLSKVESMLTPSRWDKFKTSEKTRNKNLQELVEEAAVCRTSMEQCGLSLNDAIRTSSVALKTMGTLIQDLNTKRDELKKLESFINENIGSFDVTAKYSVSILTSNIESLSTLTANAEKLIESQSVAMTTALMRLKYIPEYHQKIKELVAAGAPARLQEKVAKEEIKKVVESKKVDDNPDILGERVLAILDSKIDSEAKLSAVVDLLITSSSSLRGKDAEQILEKIPRNVNWVIEGSASKFRNEVHKKAGTVYGGHTEMEVIIAYEVAIKAESRWSHKTTDIIEQILTKHASGKIEKYAAAVALVLADIKTKLK